MKMVFQVVDGVDKGRTFQDLDPPITIGREEGNGIRLNDDRVSRFHAKIQEDQEDLVLTDLDSTNGTRVNGEAIQVRCIRVGDRINVGRSVLVYGTQEQLAEKFGGLSEQGDDGQTVAANEDLMGNKTDIASKEFELGSQGEIDVFDHQPPPLPKRLSPAQAAQLSELIDYLHRGLADATSSVYIETDAHEAKIPVSSWQRIQALLSILSRYSRFVAEPDSLE